jgi:AP-4 complex subunit epsilon-1
MAVRDAVD